MKKLNRLLCLLYGLLSISPLAGEFYVIENWSVTKQCSWNRVLRIMPLHDEFMVSFFILARRECIANKFNEIQIDDWEYDYTAPSLVGFGVMNINEELKENLQKRLTIFNQEFIAREEQFAKQDKENWLYGEPLLTKINAPIKNGRTKHPKDIAFHIDVSYISTSTFNEIKNIFRTEDAVDQAIFIGLEKIHLQFMRE